MSRLARSANLPEGLYIILYISDANYDRSTWKIPKIGPENFWIFFVQESGNPDKWLVIFMKITKPVSCAVHIQDSCAERVYRCCNWQERSDDSHYND